VVKGGQVYKVIVEAPIVSPSQLCIVHCKRFPVHWHLDDARVGLIVVTSDLEPGVLSKLTWIRDRDSSWSGHEPVVDIALCELVLKARIGHKTHTSYNE
jgi:hypothetical protein